jgi:hypothetical protein
VGPLASLTFPGDFSLQAASTRKKTAMMQPDLSMLPSQRVLVNDYRTIVGDTYSAIKANPDHRT